MSTLLTINVINEEDTAQNMFFFQEPAVYAGGPTVYSNSLYSANLGPTSGGSTLTFQANLQYYAGIQEAHSTPEVGQASGYTSASQAIDLALASGGATNDFTEATLNPLALSAPTAGEGIQDGAFRIAVPSFSPPALYNVGSAVQVNGLTTLSNFVQASPNTFTDCQPILKYYVQTGSYTAGTVMNFTQSSQTAALCDFTGGYTTAQVKLKSNGTWDVSMS